MEKIKYLTKLGSTLNNKIYVSVRNEISHWNVFLAPFPCFLKILFQEKYFMHIICVTKLELGYK